MKLRTDDDDDDKTMIEAGQGRIVGLFGFVLLIPMPYYLVSNVTLHEDALIRIFDPE